jgi:heme/copper-type cytochrome/quinol oxidase subunit 2
LLNQEAKQEAVVVNVNTLMVFVILPITLGVAVFVSLIAVNYIAKRGKDRRTQHDIQ